MWCFIIITMSFKMCSFRISNPSIPGLLDFLRSYSKLCRVLADEVCIKYSVELSDLELEDVKIDDDNNDVQITVAENKSPNGMNMY